MNIITGNILNTRQGIICQQVNAQYVMGAGLALQIAQRWPAVKRRYLEDRPGLGKCQIVNVDTGLFVANLVGQKTYGRTGCHTDYSALTKAIQSLQMQRESLPVYIPYGMGAGLAGGEWPYIMDIICHYIPDVTLVKFSPLPQW